MIAVPYVDRLIELSIPQRNLLFDVGPRDTPPVASYADAIRVALANAIGAPPLRQLVQPGQKVIVISDDNTRATPTRQIVPILLDELNAAGIPDRDISVIIAQGTHRPMTPAELDAKYGPPVLSRVPVVPHRYKDPASLVDYGVTRRGTRIIVNRHVVEADVRIAVGNIIPHHPTGWSAGAKAVLPGVAGEQTVAEMHYLGGFSPALGRVDTPMRQEMEDFAAKIGLDFIVNTVLNRQEQLVAVVAGHFVAAHRAGVEVAQGVYGQPIPALADLVISSTSPVDFDLFQSDKGLASAELATKPGGEIVLLAGCLEGVSPAHPELAEYLGKMSDQEIFSLYRSGGMADPLTGAEAVLINSIKSKMRITIASEGLAPALCRELGFRHVWPSELDAYIRQRLAEAPGMRIGVLRQSAEVLPIRGS